MKRKSGIPGFSLVEVVIALAIVSFSLVVILGLFPIGMQTATNSITETRSTMIAQTILADLRSGPFQSTRLVTGTDTFTDVMTVDLATTNSFFLSFGENGVPTGEITGAEFTNGVRDATFLARIDLEPSVPTNRMTRVSVYVHAPARLSEERPFRRRYSFVDYIAESL